MVVGETIAKIWWYRQNKAMEAGEHRFHFLLILIQFNEKEPVLFQPMAAILFLPCVGHRVAICMKAVKQVQCGRDLKTLGPILIAPDGTPNPRYRPMAVNYILFRKEMVALVVMISGIRS